MAGEPIGEHSISRLSIQITAGTNSEEEKAAWIRAAADLLECLPHDAPHYLTIIEIPGTDWGFNGIAQTARKIMRV
ncbi:hypothetical protein ACQZ6Z_26990 [Agrobacterium vitis]